MSAPSPRLVVVLGYAGRAGELHEVCAARLRRAEQEARPDDVVLLSGWSRWPRQTTEAELMASAWQGNCSRVLLDRDARTTLSNAVGAARVATEHGAREVVLVTSGWHGRRSRALLAAALRGSEVEIVLVSTNERGSTQARIREAACWALVPVQAALARRRAGARTEPSDGARVEAG